MCHLHLQAYLASSFSILTLPNWLSEGLALNFQNGQFSSLIPVSWTAGQCAIWLVQLLYAAALIEFHFLALAIRLC